jgi:hypothetical protein
MFYDRTAEQGPLRVLFETVGQAGIISYGVIWGNRIEVGLSKARRNQPATPSDSDRPGCLIPYRCGEAKKMQFAID